MDDDGSGKITYTELADLVRNELQLDERQCPDLRLRGVWRALDADGSGYLTAGEFGHFMRRAEAQPESSGAYGVDVGWRTKLHKKRRIVHRMKTAVGNFFKEHTIADLLPYNQKLVVLNHEMSIS